MKKKWYFWLFPILWMGIIFYSSAQPYEKQDIKPFFNKYIDFSFLEPLVKHIEFTYHHSQVSVEALGINGFVEFFIRKGAHFTVYLILFLLFVVAFHKTTNIKKLQKVSLSLLFTVFYAIFDEIHQGWTPNRTPFYGDVIIDTIGAIVGAGLFLLISNSLQNRKKGM
ncbi:VanZ family protein [Salirhabdus sp. Marseille-P4669]|uniref:VanZ family protein n=1 Tax=Salirhabdus sp. Marseille-P4669 TaxID=2042310 RepID=UPI000C7ADB8B|nr:VanZ family protein [Salirhabdus sp. Marseille-P4669]